MSTNHSSPAQNRKDGGKFMVTTTLLMGEMAFIIAIPALLFGFGGAYIDRVLGITPILTISGFLIAMITSSFLIYRKIKLLQSLNS